MADAHDPTLSIIDRIAHADGAAIGELLGRYGDLLWSLASRMAPAQHAREEAVLESCAAIRREASNYTNRGFSDGLIVSLIARRRLSYWRHETGDNAAPLEDGANPPLELASAPADAEGWSGHQVLSALATEQQRVVLLAVTHGLRPVAVASITGWDETAVLACLRRALDDVRLGVDGGGVAAPNRRLLDLLADAVARPLDDAEQTELDGLLADTEGADGEIMERSAAAMVLALAPPESMPASVRELVGERERRLLGAGGAVAGDADRGARVSGEQRSRVAAYWLAAAGLVLAIVGWWPTMVAELTQPQSPAKRLEALHATASDALEADWQPGGAAGNGVAGRIVWSSKRQEGYMLLDNVRPNNPGQSQYQLWIYDAGREGHPVNGGLFNVPANQSSVVIPIDPELAVDKPSLFAITREQPGGVVVSEQDQVVAKAEPGTASDD